MVHYSKRSEVEWVCVWDVWMAGTSVSGSGSAGRRHDGDAATEEAYSRLPRRVTRVSRIVFQRCKQRNPQSTCPNRNSLEASASSVGLLDRKRH